MLYLSRYARPPCNVPVVVQARRRRIESCSISWLPGTPTKKSTAAPLPRRSFATEMLRMWNTHVSQRWMADRTNLKSTSGIRPGGAVRVRFLQEKECPQGQSICYGDAAHVEHACLTTRVYGRPHKLEVEQLHQARGCCHSHIPAGKW